MQQKLTFKCLLITLFFITDVLIFCYYNHTISNSLLIYYTVLVTQQEVPFLLCICLYLISIQHWFWYGKLSASLIFLLLLWYVHRRYKDYIYYGRFFFLAASSIVLIVHQLLHEFLIINMHPHFYYTYLKISVSLFLIAAWYLKLPVLYQEYHALIK